ncbi:MAG TPA: hypothetical protein PLB12_04835 [Candidatus Goldiibacteriota bacterium]|nr:hypothetical protein [Candidatus Goldiibacteriota bacterium]HPI04177.1 hypothetical protein [Candidatus Goldiibacteriota bacterium]HPN64401.1 hypothetical protein [Candidatus Goldiibacteriota bacterium]HRQ43657.1 hypothetical protein [Candidatus Goldiibacteriota bacterium]
MMVTEIFTNGLKTKTIPENVVVSFSRIDDVNKEGALRRGTPLALNPQGMKIRDDQGLKKGEMILVNIPCDENNTVTLIGEVIGLKRVKGTEVYEKSIEFIYMSLSEKYLLKKFLNGLKEQRLS